MNISQLTSIFGISYCVLSVVTYNKNVVFFEVLINLKNMPSLKTVMVNGVGLL